MVRPGSYAELYNACENKEPAEYLRGYGIAGSRPEPIGEAA